MELTAPDSQERPTKEGTCAVVYVDEERIAKARASIPPAAAVEHVADAFGMLSDPTRLRILIALCTGELCVCELARLIERSMAATSHQLKLLRHAGLVTYRMSGKLAYYKFADAWTRALLQDALRQRSGRNGGPR